MALLAGCDSQVVGLVGSYVPSSPAQENGLLDHAEPRLRSRAASLGRADAVF